MVFGRLLGISFVVAIVVIYVAHEFSRIFFAYTSDAYVLSDYVVLSPTVAGPITRLYVENDAVVAKGDPLFEIDPEPYALSLDVAKANVALAEQSLQSASDALTEAAENIASAKAVLDDTRVTRDRLAELLKDGTVTQQRVDDINRDLAEAQAAFQGANAAQAVAQDLVEQRRSQLASAQAREQVANYELGQTKVFAPFDGYVVPFQPRIGQYIDAGTPVMAVVSDSAFRVVANLPEQHLGFVTPGEPVYIMLASNPWVIHKGHVTRVARGVSRSDAAPLALPFVDPSTDWIRLSARFPVEIALGESALALPLFLGADARVLILHTGGDERSVSPGEPGNPPDRTPAAPSTPGGPADEPAVTSDAPATQGSAVAQPDAARLDPASPAGSTDPDAPSGQGVARAAEASETDPR